MTIHDNDKAGEAAAFMQIAKDSKMLFEVRDLISTLTDPKANCPGRTEEARRLLPLLDAYLHQPVAALPVPAVPDATALRNEGYDVICDRRDLFDFLRAAWRDGRVHQGEMGNRERWDIATQHATKTIQGWATLRHVAAAPAAPSVSADARAAAFEDVLAMMAVNATPNELADYCADEYQAAIAAQQKDGAA